MLPDFGVWCRAVENLLFPRAVCPFCEAPLHRDEEEICAACRKILNQSRQGLEPCLRCATFVPAGQQLCSHCASGEKLAVDCSRAAFPYEGMLREKIWDYKYHGAAWLDKPLGSLMLSALRDVPSFAADIIIPVPLHPKRQLERGYNQSERLARFIADKLGLTMNAQLLVRSLNTPSQTALKRAARLDNLRGAFMLSRQENLAGKKILLVDDIFTTGATVNACARILKEGGSEKIFVITCAAGKQQ